MECGCPAVRSRWCDGEKDGKIEERNGASEKES